MKSMGEEQIKMLARTRRLGGREITKVIAWAKAEPGPDKVPWLLLLNFDGNAGQKFSDDYWSDSRSTKMTWQQAWDLPELVAFCAESDPEILWQWLERDWDNGRVELAALALTRRPAWGARLKKWAGSGSWQARCANYTLRRAGLNVAETKCGNFDEEEEDRQRMVAWPKEWRMLPPPSKPVSRPTAEFGTRGRQLTEGLERILAWYRREAPQLAAQLQPGLTAAEIDQLSGPFRLTLPEELYELYRWRNGTDEFGRYFLLPDFRWLSMQEAIDYFFLARDTASGPRNGFHFLECGSQHSYFAVVEKSPAPVSKVKELFVQTPPARLAAPSVTELILQAADRFDRGDFLVDAAGALRERLSA